MLIEEKVLEDKIEQERRELEKLLSLSLVENNSHQTLKIQEIVFSVFDEVDKLIVALKDTNDILPKIKKLHKASSIISEFIVEYASFFTYEGYRKFKHFAYLLEGSAKFSEGLNAKNLAERIQNKDELTIMHQREAEAFNLFSELAENYYCWEALPSQARKELECLANETLESKQERLLMQKSSRNGEDLLATLEAAQERFILSVLKAIEQDKFEDQRTKDIEETIAIMNSWATKYEQEEMHETLEALKKGIDIERKFGRKLFS